MEYLRWFDNQRGSLLSSDVQDEWKLTSWIVSNTDYGRNIDLHAIGDDEDYEGATFCCKDLNALGLYDIKDVTGLDYCVIAQLVERKEFPKKIRNILTAVETFGLERIYLKCNGGTHRSVGAAYFLMLTAYPQAQFTPHTFRVLAADQRRLEASD